MFDGVGQHDLGRVKIVRFSGQCLRCFMQAQAVL